jgi:ABC-2 type transport system permease protein
VWRTGTVVTVLIGVWAILAATRITQGEEDAGRWDLLIAGQAPLQSAVAVHLLAVGLIPIGLAAAVRIALAGASAGGAGAAVDAVGLGVTG